MLFKKRFLAGIRDGKITLAFRRWKRPTVKKGGTLLTAVGQVQINTVKTIEADNISAKEAQLAGFESAELLLKELNKSTQGQIYRIELGSLSADPRIALRDTVASGEQLKEIGNKLQRLDKHAEAPWTLEVLGILKDNSGVRAADLCQRVNQEKMQFKRNVRKLKNLGLTESLGTGYCLSQRGKALLKTSRKN